MTKFYLKNYWTQNVCFYFSLQFSSETFLILKRIQRDIFINVHTSSCKVHFIFSDFKETGIIQTQSWKLPKNQISWKSVRWEPSCSMRTDKQTHKHDEANNHFSRILRTQLKTQFLSYRKLRVPQNNRKGISTFCGLSPIFCVLKSAVYRNHCTVMGKMCKERKGKVEIS
jgi:hypothetical protein